MIKDAFQENPAKMFIKLPEIWTAINLESNQNSEKICKVTKHDTRIKISVSKCKNFGSFLHTVALKSFSKQKKVLKF